MQFLQHEAIKDDLLKPIPEFYLNTTIKIFDELLPTAKALLSRTENTELRNQLSEVVEASEFIHGKLQSGNKADIDEVRKYLKQRQSTVAGYLGRLIIATVNVLGDLSKKQHAKS